MSTPLLDVRNLSISFESRGVTHAAVNNLSFSLNNGEILGMVGESGSGKSVSCYSLLGLIPSPPGRVESGEALFEGVDLLSCTEKQLRALRGAHQLATRAPHATYHAVERSEDRPEFIVPVRRKTQAEITRPDALGRDLKSQDGARESPSRDHGQPK